MAVTQAETNAEVHKLVIRAQREAHEIVVQALGKPIPEGALVHHADVNNLNNKPSNLVLCEDRAYHELLHQRTNALRACGNVNWRKCNYCKKYDDPSNLVITKRSIHHRACRLEYTRKYSKEYYKNGEKGKRTLKLEAINQFLIDLRNVNF